MTMGQIADTLRALVCRAVGHRPMEWTRTIPFGWVSTYVHCRRCGKPCQLT